MSAPSKATVFLSGISALLVLMAGMFLHASALMKQRVPEVRERKRLVRTLGLTDLCLVTEARYTRHPSVADLHTPFQDHPLSLEHFPSGSIIEPPPHIGWSSSSELD